jgi:hypothetical protein
MPWQVEVVYEVSRLLTPVELHRLAEALQVPEGCVRQPVERMLEAFMLIGRDDRMRAPSAVKWGLERMHYAIAAAVEPNGELYLRQVRARPTGPMADTKAIRQSPPRENVATDQAERRPDA